MIHGSFSIQPITSSTCRVTEMGSSVKGLDCGVCVRERGMSDFTHHYSYAKVQKIMLFRSMSQFALDTLVLKSHL